MKSVRNAEAISKQTRLRSSAPDTCQIVWESAVACTMSLSNSMQQNPKGPVGVTGLGLN
jgi:hypothetical protein